MRAMVLAPAHRARLSVALLVVVYFAATVVRGTGVFLYDAAVYWGAAAALVGGGGPLPDGYVEAYAGSRGALGPLIYAPAALATRVFDASTGPLMVLLQNALVSALVAVVLLPAVIRIWRPVTMRTRIVVAVVAWIILSGFAPYPLMDVYAAIAVIAVVPLARSTRPVILAVAGVVAGVAINLRPASLAVVVVVAIVVIIWRRWRGALFSAGVIVALLPQVIVNRIVFNEWALVPVASGQLAGLQAGFASYVVRYDTILGDARPQQFYCSPDMTALVANSPPQSVGELILTFLRTIPDSILFALEKVGANLHWSALTPYSSVPNPLDAVFGIVTIVIAVAGATALLFAAVRSGDRLDGYGIAAIGSVLGASVLTIVGSAAESRFALVLLLMGAVGLGSAVSPPEGFTQWIRRGRWWWVAALVITIAFVSLAYVGLAHPAPRGVATLSTCIAG